MKIEKKNLPFIEMKINGKYFPIFQINKNCIYNNNKGKDTLYLYIYNILYHIKYNNNNEFNLIQSFKFNELNALNYILNKYKKFNNIIINCKYNSRLYSSIKNDHFWKKLDFLEYIHEIDDIIVIRPQIESNLRKKLNDKNFITPINGEIINKKTIIKIKKNKKNKKKFIRSYKLDSKKIINHPKSFKKKYR